MKKTYRIRLKLDGDNVFRVYRTDGIVTFCCCTTPSFFVWEKNTKYNGYNGWSGYLNKNVIEKHLNEYNPDSLVL